MTNEELLLEELSVSREVENAADRLRDEILEVYYKQKPYEYSDNMTQYKGNLVYEAFGISFKVDYKVFVIHDIRKIGVSEQYAGSDNSANIENNTLTVSLLLWRNKFLTDSDDSIAHEMMRFFQWAKKKQKNVNATRLTNDLYTRAVCVLNDLGANEEYRKSTDEEKTIAKLIYYSTSREQDAYVNGYYAQMRNGDNSVCNMPQIYSAIKDYESTMNDYEYAYGSQEMKDAFLFFKPCGLTHKSLKYVVNHGYERFLKKKSRVDKLLDREKELKNRSPRQIVTEETIYSNYIRKIVKEVLNEMLGEPVSKNNINILPCSLERNKIIRKLTNDDEFFH